MLELYTARAPNAQRAILALEVAGLPYRAHMLDLVAGDHRQPNFLRINPLGAVPVLVDPHASGGTLTLTQSIAILIYTAERTNSLIPSDATRRLKMFEWLMLGATDVSGTSAAIIHLDRFAPDKSAANLSYFESRLRKYFASCDAQLAESEYLAGELTLADLALYPFFVARSHLAAGMANLSRWGEAMSAIPAVAKAMAI